MPPKPVLPLSAPSRLRCEYFENPIGLDEPSPRLAWENADRQAAYQIRVASDASGLAQDDADVWKSDRVKSGANVQVAYGGPKLKSRRRYYWSVRVWDAKGRASPWSEAGWWEMGLLAPKDWQARWVADAVPRQAKERGPSPYLRRAFVLRGAVARARVYVTALGLYEMWINGRRVGADSFTPGWTDYSTRVQYQTYDVTDLLRDGDNVVGAILGDGWYCGDLGWELARPPYGNEPSLRAQLEITYTNGSTETIATDRSWKTARGAILANDFYHGETHDARLEPVGWNAPGFGDAGWQTARELDAPRIALSSSASPPVRRIQELKPIGMTEPKPGAFVFDLGQNMVGFARLAVSGPAGTTVTLRFAEVLIPDGTIYTTSLRSARCTDQYTLSGNGPETYEPRFTFHGFRYVEITGFPGKPSLDAITGVVLHSDYRSTGAFACSNAMLNQLQGNIVWGQKGNFLDVPTDCPQRDERLGWTGDIQVFCRTACFNGDVAGFLTKWLVDLTDAQSPKGAFPMVAPNLLRHAFPEHSDGGPAWADAGVICPWTLYLCYGDTRVLERNYDAMLRYMAYLDKTDYRTRHCFGDWLNIDDPTPKDLIGPAFHAYDAQLMAKIAHVLGHRRDAAKFAARAKRLRAEFNEEFVTPTGRLAGGSQTAHVLALHFDLLPPPRRTQAAERLVQRVNEFKDHLSTGFVGTPYLLHVLTRFGHLDLAYKLLLNEDFPSWGYPIKHGNATTMWERWDGWRHDKGFQDPAMNSFNHYAYGAVGDWIYQNILGIELDESRPGYEHFFVRPVPGGGLTWARGEYQSVRGMIGSEWKIEDGRFLLQVTVPGQTQATIALPGRRGKSVRVGPGTHRLETKWDTAARPVTRTARPVSV